MRGYLGTAEEQACNGGFRFVGNRVSLFNGEKGIDLEVEFHKHPIAGIARAQIMDTAHARARQHRAFDPPALFSRELAIEKLRERAMRATASAFPRPNRCSGSAGRSA
jgi:hypothetical protein